MPEHQFLPAFPGSRIDHVGTYMRVLPVTLERMFENALDWEHLPWLHRSSFTAIACEDAGPWGWRARVLDRRGEETVLELRLDTRQRRWVTRALAGAGAGAEIWTTVIERAPECLEILVDFFVPGVPEGARMQVGQAYARVYEALYDEDVRMMQARHRLLLERVPPLDRDAIPLRLGRLEDLRFPLRTDFAGRPVLVWLVGGKPQVTAARCPHMGAGLEGAALDGDCLTCPWHGFRFSVLTGEDAAGSDLSVRTPFAAWLRAGDLWVGFSDAAGATAP